MGAPKTFARTRSGWQSQPTAAGALVPAGTGLGHTVLPGRRIRVVVVRRPQQPRPRKPGQRQPPPRVEACVTTDLTLSLAALLAQYRERWAVEITLRDSKASAGFGQAQGRQRQRVVGATTVRVVRAAARTVGVVAHAARTPAIELGRSRPWSRHKVAPSQLDIGWPWREALHAAEVFPRARFARALAEIQQEAEDALPLAA